MFRGLVIVMSLAACLPEAKFRGGPDDAGADAGDALDAPQACAYGQRDVTVQRTGMMDAGAQVCGTDYQVLFSDLGGHFPYQLNITNSLLLGNASVCNEERGMGIAVYPGGLVNGETQPGASGTLSVQLGGPAVVKIVLDWAQDYTCAGTQRTLQDRSTFTFFPDGRMTRWDRLRQPNTAMAGGCTLCSGGTNDNTTLYLTSYLTLIAPIMGSELTGTDISTLDMLGETYPNPPGAGLESACLRSLNKQIAFGWQNTSTRIRVANLTPVRTLAFVQDVEVAAMIGPIDRDVTTHYLMSATTSCQDLRSRVDLFRAGRSLQINDTPIGPSPDGIYGGQLSDLSVAYDPEVGPVRLEADTATVPGSFAVWIDFGAQATQNVTVTHTASPSGDWYRIQRVSASQLLFWFRDDLPLGQTITITPG